LNAKLYVPTVLITLFSLNATLAERMPAKVVAGQDVFRATDPGQVSMEGFLGHRIDHNREGWLKRHIYTEDMLLAGFRERPGSISWDKSLNDAYAGEYVGKWLHAAMLASENKRNDTTLARRIQGIAHGLMDCQTDDGYLGTYLKKDRWASDDWDHGWDVWVHKYVLIGLLSYYRATGDERALETSRGIGDLLIQTFGDGKKDLIKSGEHVGLAASSVLEPMSLLYQYSGEKRYREFCQYIIARADAGPGVLTNLERTGAVNSVGDRKAYEMLSIYVGLVEHWRATGDQRALNAVKLAWESVANDNSFITGAPASDPNFTREGETFDTLGKCVETCDQVTWIQMNWQLLRATGEPRYAAMLHRHIYNHMLTAQHPEEMKWCYYTYMEGSHYYPPGHQDGYTDRMHCCGSSGPRGIALIPSFAYMSGKDRLAINLYETSTFRATVNGASVVVNQQTNYPWDGHIAIDLEVDQPTEFDLQLLIPNFAQSATIQVSGSKQNAPIEAGKYATLHRTWSGKTQIIIDLPMPVVAHERDERYALSRGPVIFAIEGIEDDAETFRNVVPDLSSLQQASWKPGEAGFDTVNHRIWAIERHSVYVKGKKINAVDGASPNKLTLTYRPYCEAGTSRGQIFSIWLPMLTDEV